MDALRKTQDALRQVESQMDALQLAEDQLGHRARAAESSVLKASGEVDAYVVGRRDKLHRVAASHAAASGKALDDAKDLLDTNHKQLVAIASGLSNGITAKFGERAITDFTPALVESGAAAGAPVLFGTGDWVDAVPALSAVHSLADIALKGYFVYGASSDTLCYLRVWSRLHDATAETLRSVLTPDDIEVFLLHSSREDDANLAVTQSAPGDFEIHVDFSTPGIEVGEAIGVSVMGQPVAEIPLDMPHLRRVPAWSEAKMLTSLRGNIPLPKPARENVLSFLLKRRTTFPAADILRLLHALTLALPEWSVFTTYDLSTRLSISLNNDAAEDDALPRWMWTVEVRRKFIDVTAAARDALRALALQHGGEEQNDYINGDSWTTMYQFAVSATLGMWRLVNAAFCAMFEPRVALTVSTAKQVSLLPATVAAPALHIGDMFSFARLARMQPDRTICITSVEALMRKPLGLSSLSFFDMSVSGLDDNAREENLMRVMYYGNPSPSLSILCVNFGSLLDADRRASLAAWLASFAGSVNIVKQLVRLEFEITGPAQVLRGFAFTLLQLFSAPTNAIEMQYELELKFDGIADAPRVGRFGLEPAEQLQDSPIFAYAADQFGFSSPASMAAAVGLPAPVVEPPERAFQTGAVQVRLDEAD